MWAFISVLNRSTPNSLKIIEFMHLAGRLKRKINLSKRLWPVLRVTA